MQNRSYEKAKGLFALYRFDLSVDLTGDLAVTGGSVSVRALPGRAKRAQTKHFQLFLDNTTGLMFITAADGTVCYECPVCKRVLGYTLEEMTGNSLLSFVHLDDRAFASADGPVGRHRPFQTGE